MKLLPWKAMLVVALCCLFADKLSAQQLKLGVQPTILDKDAVLELNSDKQGLLLTRVLKSRIVSGGLLFNAKPGMLVYVTDETSLYLKKTTGWVKIADFTNFSAGTGIAINSTTGVISNTGVTSFNTRTGAVVPATGDYSLTQLSDVAISTGTLATNQVLTYDQTTGKWSNKAALTSISVSSPLTGAGTALSPLKLIDGGSANQILKWDGTKWVVGSETTSSRKLSINPGVGVKQVTPAVQQDLSVDRSWTIDIDNTNALWNANKLQGKAISTIAPASGQILKWNSTTSLYEPANDSTGGVVFEKLITRDLSYADQPVEAMKMKIWEGPGTGTPINGPLGTDASAWSVLSFRNGGYTTQMFMDKANLAIKEWGGNTAPLTSNSGNFWYKVVVTHGDSSFTNGGVLYGQKSSDATSEVKQDYANFFWDITNKRLGIGTNTPARSLHVNGNLRVTGSAGTPNNILGRESATGDVGNITLDANTLDLTSGALSAKSGSAVWNANKIAGVPVVTTAPATNNVLTFNGTQWEPKPGGASGLTSIGLSMPPTIFTVTNPTLTANGAFGVSLNTQPAARVLAGPVSGADATPTFRQLTSTDIPSLASLYIQNGTTAQTGNFNISGNGTVGGLTLSNLTLGSIVFVGTGKALAEKNAKFFWDNTNNRLGLGNNTPANTLEISAPTYTGGTLTGGTSGLRLTNLATATPDNPNANVLSVNSAGDVILTKNPANNNWLITGNTGIAAGSFLGTRDDVVMTMKSNNQPYLEFGRRDLLGLTSTESAGYGYPDPNQKVTHMRSALQFESPSRLYKPMFYVNEFGNFRMKGCAADDDFFEFGATGEVVNDGGFDFIVGDDGDEPIVFKSYYYVTKATTEMMRIQRGKVGIGLTAEPARSFHVDTKNTPIRLQNLMDTVAISKLLTIDANGDVRAVRNNANTTITITGTSANTSNTAFNVGTTYSMIKLNPAAANTTYYINGMTNGTGTPIDGQAVTLYVTAANGNITIKNNNVTGANKILTLNGDTTIAAAGSANFVYSAQDAAWIMISYIP
ncbi:hypothetical protein DVR12_06080 [Chitinophaga silvatica]|uniref:Uncharacterized protein n=1 Tax=Chitinophaga silvatica TaxID=2282649 RepID=A0A3E1YDZ6_9BACT|nr:hypothetical protein [Chitinophaga silvatica]RFS24762.1 hypothetical protein DVR12_06080 [Chitinophaga silvatica]